MVHSGQVAPEGLAYLSFRIADQQPTKKESGTLGRLLPVDSGIPLLPTAHYPPVSGRNGFVLSRLTSTMFAR